jgi:hypothetical protein
MGDLRRRISSVYGGKHMGGWGLALGCEEMRMVFSSSTQQIYNMILP